MSGAPIVIAAGGTGGHLFPAQALAQELARRKRTVALLTDKRVQRFDALFPGVAVHFVPAATPSRRGVLGKLGAAFTISRGILHSSALLGTLRPSVVVGFGGYPTLPPLIAAKLLQIPVCVHEQNAVLGRVNRLVAPYADAVASTFPAPKYLAEKDRKKLVTTGNPVRDAVVTASATAYAPPEPGGPLNLLVFGGSQGARVTSEVVTAALTRLPERLRARLRVTQQCRAEDLPRVRADYAAARIDATLASFFDDMPARIAGAHLVISRSGASTVTELAVIGRPAILIPLPYALDNDQKANAEILEAAGAAFMMEERTLTPEALAARLETLLSDPAALSAAAAAARREGKPHAVRALADLVETLAARRRADRAEPASADAPATHRDHHPFSEAKP